MHRTRRNLTVLFGPMFLVLSAGASAQDAAPTPPEMQGYVNRRQLDQYVRDAEAFLTKHPESESAPRVLLELTMLASLNEQKALAETARSRLLLSYPESLAAQYVVSNFKDAADYRESLNRLVKKNQERLTPGVARQICAAARIGVSRFGGKMLEGDRFLLNLALLANEAEDPELLAAARAKLSEAEDDSRQIAGIAFCSELTALEKFLRLQQVKDTPAARFYQQAFYSKLSSDERRQPSAMRAVARSHLQDGQFEDALLLVQALVETDADPQLLFWQGWCYLATGKCDEALAALERLQADYSDSAWTDSGRELAELVPAADEVSRRYARDLLAVIGEMKSSFTAVEGTLTYRGEDGRSLSLYLGLVPQRDQLEVQLRREGRLMAACRSTSDEWRVFVDCEGEVYRFPPVRLFFVPKVQLEQDPDGQFNLKFAFDFSDKPEAAAQANLAALNSRFLNTADGLLELLRRLAFRGWLPRPVETENGHKRYVWLSPGADTPELDRVEYVVSPENRLVRFHSKRLSCDRLRYGGEDEFTLAPPAWPDLPVVSKEKLDGITMMKLLTLATEVLSDESHPATQSPPPNVENAVLPVASPATELRR